MALEGKDLGDFPSIEGFPKNAAQRAGHDSDDYVATTPLARSVAEELGLPVQWFTEPDLKAWLSERPGEAGDARAVRDLLIEIQAAETRVLSALSRHQESLRDELQKRMPREPTRRSQSS